MNELFEKIRLGFWKFKQPLTKRPEIIGSPVSDLFLWRNDDLWKSFFEIIDIYELFSITQVDFQRYVTFFFYDSDGCLLFEKQLELTPHKRNTVDLSIYLNGVKSNHGTFAVFHSHTPRLVSDLGSFITERGYSSYNYKNNPLRSYVHGNLDAMSLLPTMKEELLGVKSLMEREYSLQYELTTGINYDFGVVNPTGQYQKINCEFRSINGDLIILKTANIPPKGSFVFEIRSTEVCESLKLAIKSHLVMARPLVFAIDDQSINVFHG